MWWPRSEKCWPESAVRDYFEQLWNELPDQLDPPDLAVRTRFLAAELKAGDHALDIGSGEGHFTAQMGQAGVRVVGAEVAEAALERARKRHPDLEFVLVPIDGPLPFADNAFDLVWASEVIEHIADTARWLSEVRRVLRPSGRLALTTPSHGRLRVALAGVERFSEPLGDHLHLYTRASLRELLAEFGFGEVAVRAVAGPPLLKRLLF